MGLCAEQHHLLPSQVFDNLEIDRLNFNDAKYGVVMELQDHRGSGGPQLKKSPSKPGW